MTFRILRRLPFTILMLSILFLTALLTSSHTQQLTQAWMDRLGFAPIDLLALDLIRLFTSAITTSGGIVFWQTCAYTAFFLGWAEWKYGTRQTMLIFWGIHLLTLVLLSMLIALPLHWLGFLPGTMIALSRDVGPSAGYFGAFGVGCAGLKPPWHLITGGLVLAGLAAALLNLSVKTGSGVDLSANLAHLIAFPLGWLSFQLTRKQV